MREMRENEDYNFAEVFFAEFCSRVIAGSGHNENVFHLTL